MKRKRNWLMYIPYVIALILLAIATCYDYEIATYVYHPKSLIGIIFERIILIFVVLWIPFSFYALYRIYKIKVWFLAYLVSMAYVILDSVHYWISISSYWYAMIPFILLIVAMSYFIFKQIPTSFFQKYERFFVFVLLVFLSAMAITIVWKTIWGRVRYREMLADVSRFTPWYLPQGVTRHDSFPSGHMTAISALLCLFEIHRVTSYKMPRNKLLCGCIIMLMIVMMISRMMMGAHFLSDVSMGFVITYTMYLFWKRRIYWEEVQ